MADRIGNPLTMPDGALFWPLDPRPNEVRIDDVAHSLANICRFGGRCERFYSVAQHSLLVAEIVEETHPDIALQALLHDAAEAYLGDVITPLKSDLLFRTCVGDVVMAFRSAELALHTTILIGLGVPLPSTDDDIVIAQADAAALATEARDLMGDPEWARSTPARETRIFPLPPEAAKRAFLAAVQRLSATGVGHV